GALGLMRAMRRASYSWSGVRRGVAMWRVLSPGGSIAAAEARDQRQEGEQHRGAEHERQQVRGVQLVERQANERPQDAGEGGGGLVDAEDLALAVRVAPPGDERLDRRRQEGEPDDRDGQTPEQPGDQDRERRRPFPV